MVIIKCFRFSRGTRQSVLNKLFSGSLIIILPYIFSQNLSASDYSFLDNPFDSNNPLHQQNLSTPQDILEAYQKLNTDETKYQNALSEINKLEELFRFDPHILDADNDENPDFSSVSPFFIRDTLILYSDLPHERLPAIYNKIIRPLTDILKTIADLSITRSKSRFLKPLKCLGEVSLINNPLIGIALQDIFAHPGSLAVIQACLEEIYNKETVSEVHLQGIDIPRRLAGYFYDQQIIKFLNETNSNMISSIDLSSDAGKFAFLRGLQLQGELFLMLHPTTFNLDLTLPNSDLLKDIRHGLSHITQNKLRNLLSEQDLLVDVLSDLKGLQHIFQRLDSSYPTFDSLNLSSVRSCWEEIKDRPSELLPRNSTVVWKGLENLKKHLDSRVTPQIVGVLDVNFEGDINFLLPNLPRTKVLMDYLTLKEDIWSSLANFKDNSTTAMKLEAAFSKIDSNRTNGIKSDIQKKTLILSEIYRKQLESPRQQQKDIQEKQKSILCAFVQECEAKRRGLQPTLAAIQGKKIDGWFRSATNIDDFLDKMSKAVGKETAEPQQELLIKMYREFYVNYQTLQKQFSNIREQISTNSEISNIREEAAQDFLKLWFEDSVDFSELEREAEKLEETEEIQRKLLENFQRTYQHDFYTGGKKISDLYSEFIVAIMNLGLKIEGANCTYNWKGDPTPLENIFHRVYRIHVNGSPIANIADKFLFRSQKSQRMLDVIEELRNLLKITTTVELEIEKDCFNHFLSQKCSLMSKLTHILKTSLLALDLAPINSLQDKFSQLTKDVYKCQSQDELQELQKSADNLLKAYLELIHENIKIKDDLLEGLLNISRGKKWTAARKYTKDVSIQENPRADIPNNFFEILKNKWQKHLTLDFYGCEYLLASFYETFKAISDFPEFLGLQDSHKTRNKLFHFDPFKSEHTPFLNLKDGIIPTDHIGFVAKEAIILSVNVKYLLELIKA